MLVLSCIACCIGAHVLVKTTGRWRTLMSVCRRATIALLRRLSVLGLLAV
jgi:hypothetical protein